MIGRLWRAIKNFAFDLSDARETYTLEYRAGLIERARREPEEQRRQVSARRGDVASEDRAADEAGGQTEQSGAASSVPEG